MGWRIHAEHEPADGVSLGAAPAVRALARRSTALAGRGLERPPARARAGPPRARARRDRLRCAAAVRGRRTALAPADGRAGRHRAGRRRVRRAQPHQRVA